MTDLPEISDEMARAFNRAFNEAYDRLGDDEPYEATRAGLAAALVASGYRREAGDRLEDFARWLLTLDEPGNEDRRTVTLTRIIGRARDALGDRATAVEPVGALPVAEGPGIDYGPVNPTDAAAVAYASGGGFRSHEIQFEPVDADPEPEEPVLVPCECPDPRCTNRVAVLLVGDEEPSDG